MVLERRSDLLPGEPAGIVEFCRVDPKLIAVRLGVTSDHQRRGEGPGLTCNITNITHANSRFLKQLPSNRRFEILADLEKACERRIPARRIMRLAAQQELSIMFSEHDHDRVNAWEMFGTALGTAA